MLHEDEREIVGSVCGAVDRCRFACADGTWHNAHWRQPRADMTQRTDSRDERRSGESPSLKISDLERCSTSGGYDSVHRRPSICGPLRSGPKCRTLGG
ncbi:hypothetical protein PINS_up007845 [Pythium insidiosum]|nr:hypothetical protein PINS_up007845 [Pythium insidiosum]